MIRIEPDQCTQFDAVRGLIWFTAGTLLVLSIVAWLG